VRKEFAGDLASGQLFVFRNRWRTPLKVLYFDRCGYCVWGKRLGHGRNERLLRNCKRGQLRQTQYRGFHNSSISRSLPPGAEIVASAMSGELEISKYQPKHEEDVLSVLRCDSEWDIFTNEDSVDSYKKSLKSGISYVCYIDGNLCGFTRAIADEGFFLYISELYVVPACRGRGLGRAMLERIKVDHSDVTVYLLSDEDAYYQKLGYRKVGTVFAL
jgi:ribosomal protein S18 acetylase RimI-like enzyme